MDRPNRPPNVPRFFWNLGDAFVPSSIRKELDKGWFKIHTAEIGGWSAVHFITGVILSLFTDSALLAFIIHSIWEIFQVMIGMTKWDTSAGKWDTIFDTVIFMVGFVVGRLM